MPKRKSNKRKPFKTGRETKLTPEVQKIIIEKLTEGVPLKHTVDMVGIDGSTFCKWKQRGKKEKSGIYFEFFIAVKKAKANRLAASVKRIESASVGGQVVERETKTVTIVTKSGEEKTTETTYEKMAPGQWTADAWYLERRHPDEFGNNRKEIRELQEQVKSLLKVLEDGKIIKNSDVTSAGKVSPPIAESGSKLE